MGAGGILMPDANLRRAERDFVAAARVGHLATVDRRGAPHVVPVCFVLVGDKLYSALDDKPKTVAPTALRRVRNLEVSPFASLVVDRYDEDWGRLAYVQLRGRAALVAPAEPEHADAVRALEEKYPQYRSMRIVDRPLIGMEIERVHAWSARGDAFECD
jgi:PPOX class probable F420-dependent enzyme